MIDAELDKRVEIMNADDVLALASPAGCLDLECARPEAVIRRLAHEVAVHRRLIPELSFPCFDPVPAREEP